MNNLSYGVKISIARRTLKLIDAYWIIFLKDRYGMVKHVYDIPDSEREEIYKLVCKYIAKPAARLRRIGGYNFCHQTLGPRMADDTLFALVDD